MFKLLLRCFWCNHFNLDPVDRGTCGRGYLSIICEECHRMSAHRRTQ